MKFWNREVETMSRDALEALQLKGLQNDPDIPYISNNFVYISKSDDIEYMDRDILYSILDRDPKKADAYWFISVNTTNQPFDRSYEVETYGTDYMFRINLNLGYKVKQSVNVYLRQIVHDLLATGELPKQYRDHSIYGPSEVGSFKFCMIRKMMPVDGDLSPIDNFLIHNKYFIRRCAGSPIRWFGLATSRVLIEYVPLFLPRKESYERLERTK